MILRDTKVRHRQTGCPGKVTWHSKTMDERDRVVDRFGIDYAGPFPPLDVGPFNVAVYPDPDDITGIYERREIETIYVDNLDDWEIVP